MRPHWMSVMTLKDLGARRPIEHAWIIVTLEVIEKQALTSSQGQGLIQGCIDIVFRLAV